MNDKNEIFFLEINFTCSVFYTDGYEGSADFVLKFDEAGQKGFLEHIIAEGIARHRRKKKPYAMKGNSIAGFGIYATRNIRKGDIVFWGEEKAQRLVTKRFIEKNWSRRTKTEFPQVCICYQRRSLCVVG